MRRQNNFWKFAYVLANFTFTSFIASSQSQSHTHSQSWQDIIEIKHFEAIKENQRYWGLQSMLIKIVCGKVIKEKAFMLLRNCPVCSMPVACQNILEIPGPWRWPPLEVVHLIFWNELGIAPLPRRCSVQPAVWTRWRRLPRPYWRTRLWALE